MIRQRVNLRTPALAYLARLFTVVLGLALVWYGLMLALLAIKVSPHTVNAISGYRSLYEDAATLSPSDFTAAVRWIAGVAGFLAFLLFAYLAVQELPRPYLARGEIPMTDEPTGVTVVKPHAIEREQRGLRRVDLAQPDHRHHRQHRRQEDPADSRGAARRRHQVFAGRHQ